MQAYIIDPHTKTVSTYTYSGNWRDISKAIGCDLFDVVTTPEGYSLYVDDEGLYVPDQAFFLWKGLPMPLAGKAMLLGPVDDEGNTTEITVPLIEVAMSVIYGDPRVLMLVANGERDVA